MIKINKLDKYYYKNRSNEIHVLKSLDLELPDKGMVAVFGRSGCGKTTLLNVIGGLDKSGSGNIEIDGQNLKKDTDELRNRCIGYVFQNYCLNTTRTVFDNVADALRLYGVVDEDDIEERDAQMRQLYDNESNAQKIINTIFG